VLPLAEELVLLSLGISRHRLRKALGLAAQAHPDSGNHRSAVEALKAKGLLEPAGARGHVQATPAARLTERRSRVVGLMRSPSPLAGSDAELLVLLALCGALVLNGQDRLRARHRIREIKDRDSAFAVELLRVELGVDSMDELAERILPPERDLRGANFDPGVTSAVWMAGTVHHC
jgi:hypothetical protein